MLTPRGTTARGYGSQHKALRAQYQRRMDAGELFRCWRCRTWLLPGQAWDLGHDDDDRTTYRGPEHRLERDCPAGGNRKAGTKKLNALRALRLAGRSQPAMTITDW